jgi:hypothetical protein
MIQDGDFVFSLAGPADEPELRHLVGSTPMPGSITVRFEREPEYFLGAGIMGEVCQVLIARHRSGELAAVVCRSERQAFINGLETRIGAIGQVRIARSTRASGCFSGACRFSWS